MNLIVAVLIERDGMSEAEAIELCKEAAEEMAQCDTPHCEDCANICEDWFGLEPDYLPELLEFM